MHHRNFIALSKTCLISLAGLTCFITAAWAQTPAAPGETAAVPGCASVEVQNVRPQQGYLMVSAFVAEADFGRKPATSLRLAAGEETMRFQLCGLAGAQVALMLFQDIDSDGRMGTNLLGMPTEPWGASGNPGMMGPKWETARVALDGQVLRVRMSQ